MTRMEGEMKMLRENGLVSWSPRCGAVGAGPALLKRQARAARLGGGWHPGGGAPSLSSDVMKRPSGAVAHVGRNLRQCSRLSAPSLQREWELGRKGGRMREVAQIEVQRGEEGVLLRLSKYISLLPIAPPSPTPPNPQPPTPAITSII